MTGHAVVGRFFLSLQREQSWQRGDARHSHAQAYMADDIVVF